MKNVINSEGMNPTPEFISKQHTGKFIQLLPDTYMIKGGKNDRGCDQGYVIKRRNQDEYVLIDVVDRAMKEAVDELINNGGQIRALLLSGENVLQDAYADLNTISEDFGGADVYVQRQIF